MSGELIRITRCHEDRAVFHTPKESVSVPRHDHAARHARKMPCEQLTA
jgi:hypothetical protein